MKKKTKIIIASAISVFVLGLTGLGLWLFLGSGNNGGGGTVTPTPVQYTETNLSRFASALSDLTGGEIEYEGSDLAMSTLAEIRNDYMYNAGLGFQDAQVSSDVFYKVIEFLEGLDGEEGYAGFDGTIDEGKTIFEALDIDLTDYFDQEAFSENMEGEGGMDDAVNYLMDCVSNLISDMKGSSLTQGSSAGKLRQLLDLFGTETGLTNEDIGKISYYLFDRLLETIEDKEASINGILNAKLRESASESDSQQSLIEIAATSWGASSISEIRNTLSNIGDEEFSGFITGLLDSIGSTFDGLSRTNLNTLNQVLNSLTQNIIDAGDDATQVAAAYEGAVNSLTGLASSQAADMRAKRTLINNSSSESYTFFNINSAVNDLIIQLENKFIPMVVLFGYKDLSELSILFAGNSSLELIQTVVDSVGNGMLNVLDLLSNDDFAYQLIEVLVDRAESLDDRTYSLSTVAGINSTIAEVNAQLEDLGYETNELVYVSYTIEEGDSEEENNPLNYTYDVSDSSEITEDLKNSIYEGITKIAGFDGLGDYFGIILQNVDEVVIPQSGNDREIALIVKLIAAFVGEEGNQILITRNTDNENNNVYMTLHENGFTGAIAEGFYRFASEVFKVTMGYIDMNNFVTYDKYAELIEAVVEDQSVFYLINYNDNYNLYTQTNTGMKKAYLSDSEYSKLFEFINHTSGDYTANFIEISDLEIKNAYMERSGDDFIIKQVYLTGRYSSIEGEVGSQYVNYDQYMIFLYNSSDSETLVAGLNEADIFAQLVEGILNNVPESVFTDANLGSEYTNYKVKTIAELYTIFTANDSAKAEIISMLNGLFNNSSTQKNDLSSFGKILRYVQVYNNVIAENNDYDRIVLKAVDQSGDHSTTTSERVELKVVNSSTGIVGADLAYEEAKEELEDAFISISFELEMIKYAGSEVALQEISGTTITVIGEGGAESDFTLENELEVSIKVAIRDFLPEMTDGWADMTESEQNQMIDDFYDESFAEVNSMISGENGIGQTFSGTILYLFELPQEANDGNARLSQLIGALLKVGIGNMGLFS